jgi:hypothetical protein
MKIHALIGFINFNFYLFINSIFPIIHSVHQLNILIKFYFLNYYFPQKSVLVLPFICFLPVINLKFISKTTSYLHKNVLINQILKLSLQIPFKHIKKYVIKQNFS